MAVHNRINLPPPPQNHLFDRLGGEILRLSHAAGGGGGSGILTPLDRLFNVNGPISAALSNKDIFKASGNVEQQKRKTTILRFLEASIYRGHYVRSFTASSLLAALALSFKNTFNFNHIFNYGNAICCCHKLILVNSIVVFKLTNASFLPCTKYIKCSDSAGKVASLPS